MQVLNPTSFMQNAPRAGFGKSTSLKDQLRVHNLQFRVGLGCKHNFDRKLTNRCTKI